MAIFSSLLTIDWVTVMWLAIIDFILLPNPKVKSDLFFNVINPQCHKCPHTSVCCPQTGLAKCQWNTVYRHTHTTPALIRGVEMFTTGAAVYILNGPWSSLLNRCQFSLRNFLPPSRLLTSSGEMDCPSILCRFKVADRADQFPTASLSQNTRDCR